MDMLLKWAPAFIVVVLGIVFCLRMLKRGLSTLEKFRERHLEHIRTREQQLQEDRHNIPRSEHLRFAHAALADLLHLEGDRPGFSLDTQGSALLLDTPDGVWRITLDMREQTLSQTHKVVRGKLRWQLKGFGREEEFAELAELMQNLTAYLRAEKRLDPIPAALLRRMRQPGSGSRSGT